MQTGLLHLHSFLRWAIVLFFIIAIFKSLGAGNKPFTKSHKTAGLLLMICFDINVLIGLVQWLTGGFGLKAIQTTGMGEVMKDSMLRFFAVEHLIGMLVALALVHIGKSYAKKPVADTIKHRKSVLFYTIAFIITLASIPWPFRAIGEGRGWF
ncbi:MAG TPA: hypothetical protein PKY86_05120 [Niabella sp.]|nr:hypothetical protein [Niabella sp.]HQX21327.1 hypothetical protein [Niabella sp.]HQX42448.1 hypothetical protein [Niabella sp.]HRB08101.1 hypothetical protein [Niabella sp.]HRB26906.1 hypothetical protein [Niabella sp.]